MGLLDDLKTASAEAQAQGDVGDAKYAPAWRWEQPGDGVEGVIVTIGSRITENHPEPGYPIITVRQANGEDIAIHGMTTVLKNEIEQRGLKVGDSFAAIYDGKKMSGNNRQFHAFRIAHQQGQGAPPQPAAPATAAVPAAVKDPWLAAPAASTDIPPF